MTRSSIQRRSGLHAKRGFHLGRAGPALLGLPLGETNTPNPPNTPNTPPTPAKDKNTPTATADSLPGILSSILTSVIGPVTSKSSSSIASSSSVSATSHVATSSHPANSVPAITSASPPHVVVQTATSVSSSTSVQSQTPSQTSQSSSGISAVTVIAGVGGALAATILLTVIVGFFLRRWRRNRSAENAFEASQFRRSALLLDEKDDNNIPDFPRPPSMIERRNAASPPAAYPHSNEPPMSANEYGQSFGQYGANPPVGSLFGGNGGAPAMQYGGANPYNTMDNGQGDSFSAAYSGPGEYPGYGAPPVPGIHGPGAYAPYGAVDPRYPQSQRYPQPKQYQNLQPQQQQYQHDEFGQGPTVDNLPNSRDENVPHLANPFSPLRVTKKLGSTGPESLLPDLPSSTTPPPPPSSNNPGTTTTPFVTRQSHEALPTYKNDGGYADVLRDVKIPPASLNVVNGSLDTTAVPPTDTTTTMTESNGRVSEPPRPLTVYGDDDVYGGM